MRSDCMRQRGSRVLCRGIGPHRSQSAECERMTLGRKVVERRRRCTPSALRRKHFTEFGKGLCRGRVMHFHGFNKGIPWKLRRRRDVSHGHFLQGASDILDWLQVFLLTSHRELKESDTSPRSTTRVTAVFAWSCPGALRVNQLQEKPASSPDLCPEYLLSPWRWLKTHLARKSELDLVPIVPGIQRLLAAVLVPNKLTRSPLPLAELLLSSWGRYKLTFPFDVVLRILRLRPPVSAVDMLTKSSPVSRWMSAVGLETLQDHTAKASGAGTCGLLAPWAVLASLSGLNIAKAGEAIAFSFCTSTVASEMLHVHFRRPRGPGFRCYCRIHGPAAVCVVAGHEHICCLFKDAANSPGHGRCRSLASLL